MGAPLFPMRVQASMRDPGASVHNVKWLMVRSHGAVQFVSRSQSVAANGVVTPEVTNLPGSIQQIAGSQVGARSMVSFGSSDVINGIRFKPAQSSMQASIGLSYGDSSKHENDIDFSIRFERYQQNWYSWGDTYRVVENGGEKMSSSSAYHRGYHTDTGGRYYPNRDVFEIRVNSAGKVEYVINQKVFYTSTKNPSYPLLVDTSFNTVGAKFDEVYWTGIKSFVSP